MALKLPAWGQALWAFACTVGGRRATLNALLAQADYNRASLLLLHLLRRQPANIDLLLTLAFCQRRLLRKESHLALLQQACSLDDRNPEILYQLAQTLIGLHQSDAALPYLALLKDEPGYAAEMDRICGALSMSRGDAARAKGFQLSGWLARFDNPSAGHAYLFPLAYG